ncbi:ABC transporter substrate-binding protein [Clostridium sediminicola]|uniref:ABC transporter substrate-binding protein n=1 Tax=Clostridium sediminicola TaxID=3114879 RepID=UPI0031F23FE1
MKKTMEKINSNLLLIVLLVTITLLASVGCNKSDASNKTNNSKETIAETVDNEKPSFIKSENETQLVYLDPFGNEVTIKKNPERVVSLYASFLDLWYYAGGEAVASVTSKSVAFPEGAENVEKLGSMSKVSPEKVLELQSDLVILSSTMKSHLELKDLLEENNIPYLYLEYNNYEDYIEILDLMSRIAGTEDELQAKVDSADKDVQAIIKKSEGKDAPKVLIMFATSKSVSCELENGTTGDMVKKLGGENIVSDVAIKDATRVDFSMERILEQNPDIILVKTMGDIEACKTKMSEDIQSNEAWAGLNAIKDGKYYYLPKDLFMNKPNERFPEAFEMLYDYMYGEIK